MGNNIYRDRIRQKNQAVSFFYKFKRILIIAIIIGGIYYALNKTDIINTIQRQQGGQTFEEITQYQYSDIGKVIKQSDKKIEDINEFINRYQNKTYKLNGKDSISIQNEIEIYYVYDINGNFMYEVHDLGNNSIGINLLKDYMKVYDLIQ